MSCCLIAPKRFQGASTATVKEVSPIVFNRSVPLIAYRIVFISALKKCSHRTASYPRETVESCMIPLKPAHPRARPDKNPASKEFKAVQKNSAQNFKNSRQRRGCPSFKSQISNFRFPSPPSLPSPPSREITLAATPGSAKVAATTKVSMAEYKVQFEVFEGPLDLLLYLIKKEEVDIYEVNLTKLATQFVEYLDVMRLLDLEFAGEFLVMAATLMYIKSRELLPKEQQVAAEEEDEEDPRWELIRQLVEYKKFKDAAAQLQVREIEQENIFPRLPIKPDVGELQAGNGHVPKKPEASLFDLINAVNSILKRVSQREELREIFEDKWSVSEKIEHLATLISNRERVRFSELFEAATSRSEVVCTFLALLELIRMKKLLCMQSEDFGDIDITKRPETPEHSAGAPNSDSAQPATEAPVEAQL
jgi:segregation and condensation protein A